MQIPADAAAQDLRHSLGRGDRRAHAEVRALAEERDAVILAHNYQVPEVQDVADYVGDSLGLSRQAADTDAEVIAFCGVHFMAETASILSPGEDRPAARPGAGCSLADSITADELRAWKAEHPGAVVVMYVNTTAEVKAETDYCCTSSNAVQVVEHIRREHGDDVEILFGPDMFLGAYVEQVTGRRMQRVDGRVPRARRHPPGRHRRGARGAPRRRLPHPPRVRLLDLGHGVRGGRRRRRRAHAHALHRRDARHARESDADTFIVATETGMLHPLEAGEPRQDASSPANREAVCRLHEDDHAAQAARRPATTASATR